MISFFVFAPSAFAAGGIPEEPLDLDPQEREKYINSQKLKVNHFEIKLFTVDESSIHKFYRSVKENLDQNRRASVSIDDIDLGQYKITGVAYSEIGEILFQDSQDVSVTKTDLSPRVTFALKVNSWVRTTVEISSLNASEQELRGASIMVYYKDRVQYGSVVEVWDGAIRTNLFLRVDQDIIKIGIRLSSGKEIIVDVFGSDVLDLTLNNSPLEANVLSGSISFEVDFSVNDQDGPEVAENAVHVSAVTSPKRVMYPGSATNHEAIFISLENPTAEVLTVNGFTIHLIGTANVDDVVAVRCALTLGEFDQRHEFNVGNRSAIFQTGFSLTPGSTNRLACYPEIPSEARIGKLFLFRVTNFLANDPYNNAVPVVFDGKSNSEADFLMSDPLFIRNLPDEP